MWQVNETTLCHLPSCSLFFPSAEGSQLQWHYRLALDIVLSSISSYFHSGRFKLMAWKVHAFFTAFPMTPPVIIFTCLNPCESFWFCLAEGLTIWDNRNILICTYILLLTSGNVSPYHHAEGQSDSPPCHLSSFQSSLSCSHETCDNHSRQYISGGHLEALAIPQVSPCCPLLTSVG